MGISRRAFAGLGAAGVIAAATAGVANAAESVDVDSMSLDDLVALRGKVNEAISAKLSESSNTIFGGTYVAGKDIAPGSYVINLVSSGQPVVAVGVYASLETTNTALQYEALHPGDGGFAVSLADGEVLIIDASECTIDKIAIPYAPTE